jgi:hypothetical protein
MPLRPENRRPFFCLAACALALHAIFSVVGAHATASTREQFRAFAVDMGTAPGLPNSPKAGVVDITIERWSTAAERQYLIDAFLPEGSSNALLRALRKTKRVGYIRLPNSLGYDLHYARQVDDTDGGRRILLATDRRIGYWEERNQPRSTSYPFTLIEMRLDRNNQGEGKLALATRISVSKDKQHIELENYASEPVRLTSIKKVS